VAGRFRPDALEVDVLAWMLGREVAIILVIALLVAGGSQLPKLVRTLGSAPKRQATDDDNDSGADIPDPGQSSPGP
jgi:mttA/Hcf106 family